MRERERGRERDGERERVTERGRQRVSYAVGRVGFYCIA